jgi:hypothetical protein
VLAQLKAYHDGTRVGTSNDKVMQGVAHNLSEADMRALADLVSGKIVFNDVHGEMRVSEAPEHDETAK